MMTIPFQAMIVVTRKYECHEETILVQAGEVCASGVDSENSRRYPCVQRSADRASGTFPAIAGRPDKGK